MEVEKLRYLLIIQEEGSISKAANRLYMSQPSLSKVVSSIEKSIGYKLFDRTASGLIPTAEGARYLRYAEEAVEAEERVLAEMALLHSESQRKQIVFGLAHTRNAISVSKELLDLSADNSQLIIRILKEEELIKGVSEGTIDFAMLNLTRSMQLPETLRSKEIYVERVLVGAPKDHPVCKYAVEMVGSPYPYLEPKYLQGQKMILSGEGTGLYDLCQEFFRTEEIHPDIRIFEDSVQAAKRFAEEGAGICFANEELVEKAPSDRLRFFVVGESMPLRHVAVIWKKNSEKDAVVSRILQKNIAVLTKEYKEAEL